MRRFTKEALRESVAFGGVAAVTGLAFAVVWVIGTRGPEVAPELLPLLFVALPSFIAGTLCWWLFAAGRPLVSLRGAAWIGVAGGLLSEYLMFFLPILLEHVTSTSSARLSMVFGAPLFIVAGSLLFLVPLCIAIVGAIAGAAFQYCVLPVLRAHPMPNTGKVEP